MYERTQMNECESYEGESRARYNESNGESTEIHKKILSKTEENE